MKKTILLIHHSGLLGGAGISLFNTWKTLEKEFNVICYVPEDPPELFNFLKEKGLKPKKFSFRLGKLTYYSGGNNLLSPRFWYHALNAIKQIKYWKTILKEEQVDLVFVNSKVLCWMGKIFKKNNIKSLCFVRETIPGSPKKFMNKIMRNMLDDFSAVAFLSEYDLIQTNLKNAETVVSPDYLRIEDYIGTLTREEACEKFNIDSSSFNVLFVGGTDRLKGTDIALEALNFLKEEKINLVIAGKDHGVIDRTVNLKLISKIKSRKLVKYSAYLKEYINKNNLEEKVKFIGIQKDMTECFSTCDVLIFPMRKPHQARPAFEIGVQKKPVIISNFPNINEFVQDGVNGFTFEPNNSRALAEAILSLKENNDLLKKLGIANYEYTRKYHTEEFAMEKLKNKIHEIL